MNEKLGLAIPEATNPPTELDALLQEFERGVRDAPPPRFLPETHEPRTPVPPPLALSPELGEWRQQLDSLKGQIDTMQIERQAEAETKDIAAAVAKLKAEADLPEGYSDKILVGYLNQLTLDDPRALQAWQDRAQNPRGWQRTLSNAAETLRNSNERIGSFRDDAMRAALSMRNVSTEPIRSQPRNPAADFRLSDQDWEARKQQYAAEGR